MMLPKSENNMPALKNLLPLARWRKQMCSSFARDRHVTHLLKHC